MTAIIRPAIVSILFFTLVLGVGYPLLINGLAGLIFPHESQGSLIEQNGKIVGSELIGQSFASPGYFWSRPSATAPAYNAAASSGSNLSPANENLLKTIGERVQAQGGKTNIPVDLVTASGSGLDPHISPESAEFQVSRVAQVRGISEDRVRSLVANHTEGRQFGFLGEPRVNILKLNLALDRRTD